MIHLLRKSIASALALALLLVSSLPTASAMACMMMDTMEMQMSMEAPLPILSDADTTLPDCYIECGCRLDNHLDGMPHQLAPHLVAMQREAVPPLADHAALRSIDRLTARLHVIDTPPPQTL